MRWFDRVCGVVLLLLGGIKLVDGAWLSVPVVACATTVELAVGVSFLVGRTPRLSAASMMALGLVFSVHTLAGGTGGVAGPGCGCLGPYVPDFMERTMISVAVLLLGSIRLVLSPTRGCTDLSAQEVEPKTV
jgi:hypothetical protein